MEDVEIKYEALSSDDEYEFQFEVEDPEYDELMKELRGRDSDLEEIDSEIKINCPHEGCKKSFSRKHNLIKHLGTHDMGIDKIGSVCHICGKTIKGAYSLHLKIHENAKQFRCDDCGKEFRQKVALNNHCKLKRAESRWILTQFSFQCSFTGTRNRTSVSGASKSFDRSTRCNII